MDERSHSCIRQTKQNAAKATTSKRRRQEEGEKRGTGVEPVTHPFELQSNALPLSYPRVQTVLSRPQITNDSYAPYTVHTLQFDPRQNHSYPNAPLKPFCSLLVAARVEE